MSPDGGCGWVVCFACFIFHLITDGILNSFGLIYVELLDYFKETKATTAFVASLSNGLCFLIGPFVAILVNRFGCRAVAVTGAITISGSMIASIFGPNIQFVSFSLGGMFGIGYGMLYLPSIVSINQYFEKRRSLAIGIAVSGSGIGTFVFSPFTSFLIRTYTWQGAILIQAGIALNCIACGLVYRTIKVQSTMNGESKINLSSLKDSSLLQNNAAELQNGFGITSNTDSSLNINNEDENNTNHDNLMTLSEHNSLSHILDNNTVTEPLVCEHASDSVISRNPHYHMDDVNVTCRIMKVKSARLMIIWTAFIDLINKSIDTSIFRIPSFWLFVISVFFYSLGYYIPYIYLPDTARMAGIDEFRHSWLLSSIGITDTIGRIVIGSLSDRKHVNRLIVYSTALLICGVATIITGFMHLFEVLLAYALLFGLTSGVTVSLSSVILTDIVSITRLTDAFGIYCFFAGIATFIGPPIIGWLFDMTGDYLRSYIFAGITIALSGLMLYFVPCLECKKG